MKKNHLMTLPKLCAVALLGATTFLASCAVDGFNNDERWESSVSNSQLYSPTADVITIAPDASGENQIISWPVVLGASKYECKLLDVTDPDNPKLVYEGLVDGCSLKAAREDDAMYEFYIRTLANTSKGNIDAEETTKLAYNTMIPTYKTIPSGTDLYAYFASEVIPENETDPVTKQLIPIAYDLEPDGEYTMSQSLNLGYHYVMLRTLNKKNHAKIALSNEANFIISYDFSLNYVDVDASATTKAVMEAFNYETEPSDYLKKPGNYYLINYLRLMGCSFKGVAGSLFFDNNKPYGVVTFLIQNSIIEMNTQTDKIRNEAFISFQGGGVKDFTMKNSTVYQVGAGNSKYFLRYYNSVRVDRLGWTKGDHTTITYGNNTFYKVASGNWSNYDGLRDYSAYDLQNNIWYDCSEKGDIARRIQGRGNGLGSNCTFVSANNTYWHNGAAVDQGNYDTSSSQLTTDPAFTDPSNGNFTPTGTEQLQKRTGDPRWLPAEN